MQDAGDRKMFSPLRHRESTSPEAKVCAVLASHEGGMVSANLAEELVNGGFATGTRSLVTKRVGEMLESLKEEGRVEQVADGRYRAVRPAPRSQRA